MTDSLPQILNFLRHAVGNDGLNLNIVLNPETTTAHTLTPRQTVNDMRKRNPDITDFINRFALTLA